MLDFLKKCFKKHKNIEETRKEWNELYEKTIDDAAARGVPFAQYIQSLERSMRRNISLDSLNKNFSDTMRKRLSEMRFVRKRGQGEGGEGLVVAMDKNNPADKEKLDNISAAMDEFCGTKSTPRGTLSMGNPAAQEMLTHFYEQNFIGWQACAMLKQQWIIDRACSVPPKDAMTNGYTLRLVGNPKWGVEGFDSDSEEFEKYNMERLQDIYRRSEQVYAIRSLCERASTLKKVFGWSLVVPLVKGANMEKPFNIDGVKKGSYEGMATIEPYWLTPEFDEESMQNPFSARFYRPTYYYVAGYGRIHHSWCVRLNNSVLPDIIKPMYYFGGIPLPQQLFERVYASERVSNEAPLLALTKRLLVIDMYLDNYVANQEEGDKTLEALTYLRDNFAIMCKEPGTTISQVDTNLAGFDQMMMSQWQLCCAIAEMPSSKLLKSQVGERGTGREFEESDYRQVLMRLQKSDFEPIINLHHLLMIKSEELGDIKLTVNFNPIDAPTDEQVAELTEKWSLTISHLLTLGAIDIRESRQLLKTIPYSPFGYLSSGSPNRNDLIEQVSKAAGENEESENYLAKKNGGGEAIPTEKDPKGRYLPHNEKDPT